MKVLFDNNVPAPLRYRIPAHQVDTAREKGWQELKNGDLLHEAERAGYDVLLTGDKNMAYQQNLAERQVALVVLETTRWTLLRQDTAHVVAAIDRACPGSFEAL